MLMSASARRPISAHIRQSIRQFRERCVGVVALTIRASLERQSLAMNQPPRPLPGTEVMACIPASLLRLPGLRSQGKDRFGAHVFSGGISGLAPCSPSRRSMKCGRLCMFVAVGAAYASYLRKIFWPRGRCSRLCINFRFAGDGRRRWQEPAELCSGHSYRVGSCHIW